MRRVRGQMGGWGMALLAALVGLQVAGWAAEPFQFDALLTDTETGQTVSVGGTLHVQTAVRPEASGRLVQIRITGVLERTDEPAEDDYRFKVDYQLSFRTAEPDVCFSPIGDGQVQFDGPAEVVQLQRFAFGERRSGGSPPQRAGVAFPLALTGCVSGDQVTVTGIDPAGAIRPAS